ncbi:hypothetical protein [Streptomyces sp. NPDC058583]|uniref:hypothetical protein n=1 Tax=unclassified Streptomyces TaxID=2593676 RepID=UPI00365C9DBD
MTTSASPGSGSLAVFGAPENAVDRERMRRAHVAAAQLLAVRPEGAEVWGWQGRSLGRRAGDRWLRVVSASKEKRGGRLWEGTALAATHLPPAVPRPRLHDVLDWTAGEHGYRGELTEYISLPTAAIGTPALDRDIVLPDAWWAELRTALETLASVPTDRESVRQRWIDNNFRRYLGVDPVQIREYTTGHADLHWANLTQPMLVILDWESWGRLPVGYDLGLLHAYSLTSPTTAARIRREFTHIFETPAGRTGELVALGQLLQACGRGVHPHLAPLVAQRAELLTGNPVPALAPAHAADAPIGEQ